MTNRDGWNQEALGRVASLIMGQSPESRYYTEEEIGLPFLQGCAEFGDRYPKAVLYCSKIKKVANRGSILFSVRAPVGRTNIADQEYVIGRGLAAIKALEVDQGYLAHYLGFSEDRFRNASQGSTFEAINSAELSNWPIPFPFDVHEQTKIAEVLSTVDRAIEQTEALIAKQQRIKTGLMQDLLTRGIDEHGNLRSEETHEFKDSPLGRIPVEWDTSPLSKVADLQVGYAFKSSWFSDNGVRLLRGENVGAGIPDWSDTQHLSLQHAEDFEEYLLNPGDFVIGMDRTFTKQGFKLTQLGCEDVPSLLVQRVGRFIPFAVPANYISAIIRSPTYRRNLELQQKGMDIPHLSKKEILSPVVPVPSREAEMQHIAERIQESYSIEARYQAAFGKLKRLKLALMQDLLTGKKRVTPLLEPEDATVQNP